VQEVNVLKTNTKLILNWAQRSKWTPVFRSLLNDKLTDATVENLKQHAPTHIADDSFRWLNTAVAEITRQPYVDIPIILARRLENYYESIVAFHGTRSSSASDFLVRGIKLSDSKHLEQRAIEQFGDTNVVRNAILDLRQSGYESHNHGKVFLCLTKRACLHDHPHYMLEGSEYISAIANRIGRLVAAEPNEKPLIIECAVPTA
jgi:hypothetical protein